MRSAPTATLVLVATVLTACTDATPAHPTGPTTSNPMPAKVGVPTVVVNSLRADVPDDVPCTASLCTMVQAVASVPSGGMITFSPTLCAGASGCEIPGGHSLARFENGEEVPFSVTINGPTTYSLAITNAGSRSVFSIFPKTRATIRNLTIRDGFQQGSGDLGGGITSPGTLLLENVIVRDNKGILGGGISTEGGVVELRNSQVLNNEGMYGGGGIYAASGAQVILTNTIVRGNRVTIAGEPGGGFSSPGGSSLTLLKKSCISDNEPDDIFSTGAIIGTNCP